MKRICLLVAFCLPVSLLWAQSSISNFASIDEAAVFARGQDPASLAAALTSTCKTEEEKVRAIFRWITTHISYYKANSFPVRKKKGNPPFIDENADTLLPLNERVAIKVLADRRTHCEGYARLFKSLCDHAGIQSAVVSGYARAEDSRPNAKFRSNHSWNAVYTDSSWHLLDVTWASGYITYPGENFVLQYNDYYFYTPPEEFIRHHFPDDMRWALLDEPPAPDEIRRSPFHQRSFAKYGINECSPSRGLIVAELGDTLRFEFSTAMESRDMLIAPDSIWDSAVVLRTPVYAYVMPDSIGPDQKVHYQFAITSEKLCWIHLMYNNDAVLRYRVQVRKKPEELAGIKAPN